MFAGGVSSLVENDQQILVDMQDDKQMALFEVCLGFDVCTTYTC